MTRAEPAPTTGYLSVVARLCFHAETRTGSVGWLLLHDADDSAACDRELTLFQGDTPLYSTRANGYGGFTFEAAAIGMYRLKIALPDAEQRLERVPARITG